MAKEEVNAHGGERKVAAVRHASERWRTADALRHGTRAAGNKHVALGPISLECTSEGFQEYRKDLEQVLYTRPEDPDRAHVVFRVLPEARESIVRATAHGRAQRS